MPTHEHEVRKKRKREEAVKGYKNLSSFFCYPYQVINK